MSLCSQSHFIKVLLDRNNTQSHYPFSLFFLHIQGEIGVGVPGLRGERGEPGPRVMPTMSPSLVHLFVCVSDCDDCACICLTFVGRRRSGWSRWRERPNCKYTPTFCSQHSACTHYFLPHHILFSAHIDVSQAVTVSLS